jgi:hypothetical protein
MRSLGEMLGGIGADDLLRQANKYGWADCDHASPRTDPDDAERRTGIYGSDGGRWVRGPGLARSGDSRNDSNAASRPGIQQAEPVGAEIADHIPDPVLAGERRDGSPRISPVEPYIAGGQLLIGAMTWSAKAGDLRRDPRYVLHSVVTGPDSGEGELKLHGLAAQAGPDLRGAAADAWWLAQAPDKAVVFTLHIGKAMFVGWDTSHGLMTVHRWSPRSGYSVSTRPYP